LTRVVRSIKKEKKKKKEEGWLSHLLDWFGVAEPTPATPYKKKKKKKKKYSRVLVLGGGRTTPMVNMRLTAFCWCKV